MFALLLLTACMNNPADKQPVIIWFGGNRGDEPAHLMYVPATGGDVVTLAGSPDVVGVSPSGKRAAIWSPSAVEVVDAAGAPLRRTEGRFAAFADDDTLIVTSVEAPATVSRVAVSTGAVTVLARLGGTQQRDSLPRGNPVTGLSIEADGMYEVRGDLVKSLPIAAHGLVPGPGDRYLSTGEASRIWSSDGTVLATLPPALNGAWLDADHVLLYVLPEVRGEPGLWLASYDVNDGTRQVLLTGLPRTDETYAFAPCVVDAHTVVAIGPGAISVVRLELDGATVRTTTLVDGLTRVGQLVCSAGG